MTDLTTSQTLHHLRHQANRLRRAALAGVKTVTVEIQLPACAGGETTSADDTRIETMELPIANLLAMLHSRLSQLETHAPVNRDDIEFL